MSKAMDDRILRARANKKNWPDPTPEMLGTPEFMAVWDTIKTWNINVPDVDGELYSGAAGNHVRAILDALGEVWKQLHIRFKEKGTVLSVSADSWGYTALYANGFPKEKLNELGAKGWELVAVVTCDGGTDTYVLKRAIDAEREG